MAVKSILPQTLEKNSSNSAKITIENNELLHEQWQLIEIIQNHLASLSAKQRCNEQELIEILHNLMISVKILAP
jgi:hypothetical protein